MEELDLGQTIRGLIAGQKVFARYVLKSILGRGGMGIVWRAFDEHLERDVALKFLPELVIHDKAVLDDLKRETKRNLDLTHHHIVRIYDFAQDSGSACISMEFVDGETLSALRIERPTRAFETDDLAQPISELCEALTYAHTRAGIVHRDLKPANLMLTSKGELKVTDFGIARSLSDSISMLTMGRGVSGTLLYMSPQQLDGDRPSAADDIYSVGATLYELLTSKPPFYSGGVERQIHEKVPPPMSVRRADLGVSSSVAIPAHWENCVADCLAKDPNRRPASAGELAERLRGKARTQTKSVAPPVAQIPSPAGVPSEPAATVPAMEITKRSRPNWGFYIGVATIALVLSGGLGIYLATRSPDETKTRQDQSTPSRLASQPTPAPTPTAEPRALASPPVSVAEVPSPSAAATSVAAAASTAPPPASAYSTTAGYDPAIALVDMNRIFKEYNKTKDAEKQINDAKDAAKKEYDARADTYKKGLDSINKLNQQLDSPALSADKKTSMAKDRDEKIAKIKQMEKEINEFRQTRERQLQEQAQQLRKDIVKEMTREIESLNSAKANLVLDRSGPSMNGVPLVLFSPDRADVSDKIIAGLNQNAQTPFLATRDQLLGVVDMNRIFKEYNKTKSSEAKVNEAKEAAKKEYDERSAAYETARKKADASKDLKAMEKELTDFRETRERQLQEQAMRMREAIVKEITDAIGQGRTGSPNSLLFDVSGTSMNGVPFILYSKGMPDFSSEVIAALNGRSGGANAKFHQSFATSKSLRFAAVDMNRFFKELPETKSAEAKINAAKDAAKKEYDDRAQNYKKALDEINKLNQQLDSPTLSADKKTSMAKERDDKVANIKNMEKEINDFRTQREKQLQDQAMKLREGIVAKLTAAVKSRAEQERFNVVFDSTGPSMNGVNLVVLPPGLPDLTTGLLKP